MPTAPDLRDQSLDAFLAWERRQPERYERVVGVVRVMTGGTIDHNRIVRNVSQALSAALRDRDCEVFTSDVKVSSPDGDVMYPDIVVACGEIPGKASELETPVVVFEVLSASTAERDHGPKRWAYQTIPSLRHYVLIDQNQPIVEVASPDPDGTWRSVVHRGHAAALRLDALEFELPLAEVFARVDLHAAENAGRSASPEV